MEPEKQEQAKLTEARIRRIITEDILLRVPVWALAVIIFLGGIAFGIIWFILHVIGPYMNKTL